MKTILSLAVCSILCITMLCAAPDAAGIKPETVGAKVGTWTMDFEAAQKLAAEKKLPIFINFTGSDWCGWCKHIDKEVFTKEAWQTFAKDNLILVWTDFPSDQSLVPADRAVKNKVLAEQFKVRGYPTLFILDTDGKTILATLGASQNMTAETFIDQVKQGTRLVNLQGKLDVVKYAQYLTLKKAKETADKTFSDWLTKIRQEMKTLTGDEKTTKEQMEAAQKRISAEGDKLQQTIKEASDKVDELLKDIK